MFFFIIKFYKIWNVIDKTGLKNISKLIYPSIKYTKKIYINKIVPSITLEKILDQYENGDINKAKLMNLLVEKIGIIDLKIKKNINIFNRKNSNNIKIRVISDVNLTPNPKVAISNFLFIHIHGGGFVAMTSHSHQCHTRLY